jgi:hypothetical protein
VHERKTDAGVGQMKFLQLICIENETTDEQNQVVRDAVWPWVHDTIERRINITGKPLTDPQTARTVRVRDGRTLISDGPFAATKEFIGGFDLLECESLEQAIDVAAKHPVSWFNAIELRQLHDENDVPERIDPATLRHMLLVCVDGIPEAPEREAEIWSDCMAWRDQIAASGAHVAGSPIAPAAEARTVRVRDGRTMVSDGPFVETKEFLGGFDLLKCETFDEAVGWAAKHPIAALHQIEVRSFRDLEGV